MTFRNRNIMKERNLKWMFESADLPQLMMGYNKPILN